MFLGGKIWTCYMEGLLFELKKKYIIIISPHNIQHAFQVADRGSFLEGELVEEGPLEEILTKPKGKMIKD